MESDKEKRSIIASDTKQFLEQHNRSFDQVQVTAIKETIQKEIASLGSANSSEARRAAEVLGDKCEDKKFDNLYRNALLEAGGVHLVVKLLSSKEPQEMASRLLMSLVKAGESAKQALLEEHCAIPSLAEVLQKGTSNAQSYSAAILRNLSEGSEARSKMVAQQEGAVKGLIGLVTAVINDAVSQRRATEALANLARYSGIQVGRDALSKLAQLRASCDEDLAEAATEALENLGRHSANQDVVAQVNTVYANVQKLKSDMVSDAKAAAEALLSACEDEDDDVLERLVIKLGGMAPVMKLLDGAAQEYAAGLLMLLVNVCDSVIRTLVEHPSAIPSLVSILRNGTAPAQADAAGVFRNASHLEACSKLMAEKGAIEGLVDLLRSPGPTRQRRAAGALANLASHSEELRAAVGKAGAIAPLVKLKASDHDDVAEAAADALDNLGLNDANKEEIKASEKTAPGAQPEAEEPKKVADQVQEPAKEQPTSEASAKEAGYPTPVPGQSVGLPDGAGARLAMFSLRFDNGPIEAKFRRVHQLLKNHNFNVLMVDADAGDNFGTMTMDYLDELVENKGLMISVCTKHYGEKTASPYSSFHELRYAQDYQLDVLPLKVADVYPPQPPSGPDHKYDQKGEARKLLRMVLRPNISFFDCCSLSEQEIALKIANKLLGRGHGGSGHG